MEDLSPLRENGVNIGQVGLPFPDSTLVEAAADTEYGYIEGVTATSATSSPSPTHHPLIWIARRPNVCYAISWMYCAAKKIASVETTNPR